MLEKHTYKDNECGEKENGFSFIQMCGHLIRAIRVSGIYKSEMMYFLFVCEVLRFWIRFAVYLKEPEAKKQSADKA